jgi:iron complex outermembrane receptor protein
MRPSIPLRTALAAAAWLACAPAPALAQTDTVVVTGAPRAQRVLDAPYAITAVDAAALRDAGPLVNLSEALVAVPGLVVNNRNNYAQDLQISARGFGARAGFGVRGLRLYTDGIPASMPDGQGQVAHFDLAGAQRVEVLRGPYSVLYGNSSGGVIALFGAPVTAAQAELAVDAGSFGLRQARAGLAAPLGSGFDLRASLSKLETDGFRPQSAADRRLANLRLGWQGANDRVVLLVSDHAQDAQDPLGLTWAQFQADPRQTIGLALDGYDPITPAVQRFNTRKTIAQTQAGVNWRHQFADGGVLRESSLSVYSGKRAVVQYLAIAPGVQAPVRHGGGVIDFDRRYEGMEARLQFGLAGVEAVAGVAVERQTDDRRGHENFTGPSATPTALGVRGKLRRDETNSAESRDVFLQAEWALAPAVTATVGVRSGRVDVSVDDHYVAGTGATANLDDSGQRRYSYTNPVVGLRWTAAPGWVLHASVARGFESPTLGELAYTVNNSGFNFDLRGQTSRQAELGSKWRSPVLDVDATLFAVRTDDEIGVRSNSGGRASFQNVGRTQRHGAELASTWRPAAGLRLQTALTWLHAEYGDSFVTCDGTPCPGTNNVALKTVAAGNRIAGTQRASAWAQAAWRTGPLGGEWAVEWRAMARTAANDLNTAAAPGYGLVHLRWSGKLALGPSDALELLARVDNLLDRDHVGSVIVNDGNGRFFEPGAPRSLLLSARWQHRF